MSSVSPPTGLPSLSTLIHHPEGGAQSTPPSICKITALPGVGWKTVGTD